LSLILWAVPVAAFLTALARMARLHGFSRSKKLVREEALLAKLSIAETAEAPALASPERQAMGLPGPVSGSSSPVAAGRDQPPISTDNLERLCRKFRIREISLLPSTEQIRGPAEPNLQILVDFEFEAKVDYPIFFRLRQELFTIAGRAVDLICKNSVDLEGQPEVFAQARVLYAA
jgi:predicted nucleotidyltransferase